MTSWTSMHFFFVLVFGFWLVHGASAGGGGGAGWKVGRATLYGEDEHGGNDGFSIHQGSCQYGALDKDVGTGWDIAAMSDCHPDFQGSCGKCFELACEGMKFSDNYGEVLDKTDACHDSGKTVIVTVVDSCPCNFPKNPYSNKRWCCGDMDHFDISSFAFEKLAPKSVGVIGLKYRPVPCPSYEEHLPDEPENIQVDLMPNSLLSSSSSTSRVSRTSTSDSTSTKHTSSVVIDEVDDAVTIDVTSSESDTGTTTVTVGSISESDSGTTRVIVGGSGRVSIGVNGEENEETSVGKSTPGPVSSEQEKKDRIAQIKAKVKAKAKAVGIGNNRPTTPPKTKSVARKPVPKSQAPPPSSPAPKKRKPAFSLNVSTPTRTGTPKPVSVVGPGRRTGQRVSRTSSQDTTHTHVHWSGMDTSTVSTVPSTTADFNDDEPIRFVSSGATVESGTDTGSSRSSVTVHGQSRTSVVSDGTSTRTEVVTSGGGGGFVIPRMTPPSATPTSNPPKGGRRAPRATQISSGGDGSASESRTVSRQSVISIHAPGPTPASAPVPARASPITRTSGTSPRPTRNTAIQRVSRTSSSDTSSTREKAPGGNFAVESTISDFSVPRVG